MPKISVIVPVYNAQGHLAQCLENLIYQTYSNLEIIIIDDGSPDNSSAVYNKYANDDPRIKIIRQENQGVSVARNVGIDIATGDYIHFMDADDWLDLNYYEKMLDIAKTTGADITASGIKRYNSTFPDIKYSAKMLLLNLQEKTSILELPENCYVWRYLFRHDFIKNNNLRFTPGMNILEDVVFTLNAVKKSNKVAITPHINYNYLTHPLSVMNSKKTEKNLADIKAGQDFFDEFFSENNIRQFRYRFVINRYRLPIGITILKSVIVGNTVRYYLFGMRIMKKTREQPVL
jgi:glycosyltransferase involved in cell wall biosynthesis